ncbi:MAG: hypothetical protein PHS66_05350 [Candidatus Omnitrophica bacterium]|nr:hypothetical protein [Candidatus Omnitrophota bacterium]
MSLIEAIGKLISNLPPLINVKIDVKQPTVISTLNIIKDDHSQPYTLNPVDNSCTVNLGKLDAQKKNDFLTSLIEEGNVLLLEKAKSEVDSFRTEERVPENQAIIQFLSSKIPPEDLNIWRAALYLRASFKKGLSAIVTRIKLEIMEKYGDKGRNIANLCTAGYLEEWLIPSYEKLKQAPNDEESAKSSFLKLYMLLVNELPFTVFVCHKMSLVDLRQEIDSRKKYGMDFVNIHGIGEDNVAKIKTVVDEIEKENYSEEKKGNILFVRVGFKKNKTISTPKEPGE